MIALQWFMNHQTDFTLTLKDLCLKLAHLVLTNNYVECKELDGVIYQQVVGTALGTSVLVVIIFMIWLETSAAASPCKTTRDTFSVISF
jgi:hypothetical protein